MYQAFKISKINTLVIHISRYFFFSLNKILAQCEPFKFELGGILEWPSKSRIMNSIKPHRVQHILRHFYYTTMQKLCEFEALSKPENQCNCHKGSP